MNDSRSTNEQDGEPLAYLLTGKQGFKSVQRVKPPADSEWEVTPLFARSSTSQWPLTAADIEEMRQRLLDQCPNDIHGRDMTLLCDMALAALPRSATSKSDKAEG